MTQPAQQPPAGPPPQPAAPAGQQPPPAAPPAQPATPAQQPPAAQPQQPPAPAYPYGAPPQTPPQQPPTWPQPVPGQPPAQPYQPQPYPGYPQYPAPTAPPAQPPAGQPAQPPLPGDDGQGGYDLNRLPRAARDEIERLRGQVTQRDMQLRTTAVSQHAQAVAQQQNVNVQALLGSLAWQQAAAQLDPAAPDYAQRLAWTVQGIAAQNPWMAAQGATPPAPPAAPPPASGADFSGAGGAGQPITEAQLAQMTPEQIAQAMTEGKLKHLL